MAGGVRRLSLLPDAIERPNAVAGGGFVSLPFACQADWGTREGIVIRHCSRDRRASPSQNAGWCSDENVSHAHIRARAYACHCTYIAISLSPLFSDVSLAAGEHRVGKRTATTSLCLYPVLALLVRRHSCHEGPQPCSRATVLPCFCAAAGLALLRRSGDGIGRKPLVGLFGRKAPLLVGERAPTRFISLPCPNGGRWFLCRPGL
ncbi:hypothetical protein LZ30DRAFT_343881 [Colletotrichum cereale]|nr:hypothetical protein LZ30DRAFT_343881 [Colletotrichum cereale]